MMPSRLIRLALFSMVALVAAGCGGGGGGSSTPAPVITATPFPSPVVSSTATAVRTSTPTPSPSPSPTPTTAPTTAPTVNPAIVDASGTGAYPMTATGGGAVAGNVEFDAGGSLAIAISTAQPAAALGGTIGSGALTVALAASKTQSTVRRVPQTQTAAFQAGFVEARSAANPELERFVQSRPSLGRRTQALARSAKALPTTQGATASIWAQNATIGQSSANAYLQIPATLQLVTAHGYIWVDNTLTVSGATVAAIGNDFENAWTSDTVHFGSASYPSSAPGLAQTYQACDSNGAVSGTTQAFITPTDGKVHVFVVNPASFAAGVGGYFGSENLIPQAYLNCFLPSKVYKTNESPMIYVGYNTANTTSYETGEDLVRGTAHELQHLIRYVNHAILIGGALDPTFLDEGSAMLAQDFAVNQMYAGNPALDVADAMQHAKGYLSAPQSYSLSGFIGINTTTQQLQYNCSNCYGLAYLFQRYLYDRFGGDAYTRATTQTGASGFANITAATGQQGAQLIADFAGAIGASGTPAATGKYTFSSINLRISYTDQFGNRTNLSGPAFVPLSAGSSTGSQPYLGAFAFFNLGTAPQGSTLTIQDSTGLYGLAGAVIQR